MLEEEFCIMGASIVFLIMLCDKYVLCYIFSPKLLAFGLPFVSYCIQLFNFIIFSLYDMNIILID